jgi:hypothetical protein
MPGQTTERAFETCVEEVLLTRGGWQSSSAAYQGATMERLEEYRTALITAAVTGKIDVRQAALAALDGGGGLT